MTTTTTRARTRDDTTHWTPKQRLAAQIWEAYRVSRDGGKKPTNDAKPNTKDADEPGQDRELVFQGPAGTYVSSTGGDGTFRVWRIGPAKVEQTVVGATQAAAARDAVRSVADKAKKLWG